MRKRQLRPDKRIPMIHGTNQRNRENAQEEKWPLRRIGEWQIRTGARRGAFRRGSALIGGVRVDRRIQVQIIDTIGGDGGGDDGTRRGKTKSQFQILRIQKNNKCMVSLHGQQHNYR